MSDDEKPEQWKFQGRREPITAESLADPATLREALQQHLSDMASLQGFVSLEFVFAHADKLETYGVPGTPDDRLGKEAVVAVSFAQFATRDGVLRAFRTGECLRDTGDGHRRALLLVEWFPGTDRWWLAWRLMGTGEAGVGVFHGDWQHAEGDGLEALGELDESFREWLDTGEAAVASMHFDEQPTPSEGMIEGGLLSFTGPLPVGGNDVAIFMARSFHLEEVSRPLGHFIVFILREGALERYDIKEKTSAELDPLIRALAATQSEPPHAIALVHPATAELADGKHRAIVFMVETAGRRGTMIWVQRVVENRLVPKESMYRDQGEVPTGKGWIGVAPEGVEVLARPLPGQTPISD